MKNWISTAETKICFLLKSLSPSRDNPGWRQQLSLQTLSSSVCSPRKDTHELNGSNANLICSFLLELSVLELTDVRLSPGLHQESTYYCTQFPLLHNETLTQYLPACKCRPVVLHSCSGHTMKTQACWCAAGHSGPVYSPVSPHCFAAWYAHRNRWFLSQACMQKTKGGLLWSSCPLYDKFMLGNWIRRWELL